jgi:hypothetical protein
MERKTFLPFPFSVFFHATNGSCGNLKKDTVKNTATGLALKIRINSNKERQKILTLKYNYFLLFTLVKS